MPTAVSNIAIMPPPPPQISDASSSDSGPSKFDDALDQARQKDSSAGTKSSDAQSTSSSAAPDKSAKTSKTVKAVKPTNGKAAGKTESSDDDVAARESAPQAKAADPTTPADPEIDEPAKTPPNAKEKAAAHAAHPDDETPSGQLVALGQDPRIVNAIGKDPKDSSRQSKDQPAKGGQSVEAIDTGDDQEADAEQIGSAANRSNAAAGSKNAAENPAIKLGGAVGPQAGKLRDSQASSATSSAPPDDALVAAIDAGVAEGAAESSTTTSSASSGGNGSGDGASHTVLHAFFDAFATASAQGQVPVAGPSNAPAAPVEAVKTPPPLPPEVRFAEANQAKIVSSVHTQLLPNGGSMEIRLDPPELGSMSVSVHMRDGVMTATFETSTDQAARLLTHNLGQLKTALEAQGVSVGRLHVEQAPRDPQAGSREGGKNHDGSPKDQTGQQQQQDQQRREMLRQMWRRLDGGKDPLDMVA